MLTLEILGNEFLDESTMEILYPDATKIQLEHSLVALSKWESEHEKPFLSTEDKTADEVYSYIQAMTITPNVPPEVYFAMSAENLEAINDYMNRKMTATTVYEPPTNNRGKKQTITAELIYAWMIAYGVDIECETWHLNRLFMLLRVRYIHLQEQNPNTKKRTPPAEAAASRRELNRRRLAEMGTTG